MARAGRKRSESSRQRIIEASLELMAERGYAGITIDEIAIRAKVGKQTIYRWWRTKAEVMLEVAAELGSKDVEVPRTGKLKTDLDRYLKSIVDSLSDDVRAQVLRGLIAEVQSDPKFHATYQDRFLSSFSNGLESILKEARSRGEIGKKTDTDLVQDMVLGALWYRLLFQHAPLDASFAKSLSKMILGSLT